MMVCLRNDLPILTDEMIIPCLADVELVLPFRDAIAGIVTRVVNACVKLRAMCATDSATVVCFMQGN